MSIKNTFSFIINKKNANLLVGFWAFFTTALLVWWVIFSFRQLGKLKALDIGPESEILKHQTMLIYEGITLFLCMLLGTFSLVYFVYRENARLKERKDFLSVFTHDLKTTLTSLRLRLERLLNKKDPDELKKEAQEVQKIGTRLNQQLQNALQFSYSEFNKAYLENVDFNKELRFLKPLWSDMKIVHPEHKCFVRADVSLMRGVLSNIIQNAYDHSKVTDLEIVCTNAQSNKMTQIDFIPKNGAKFLDDIEDFKNNFFIKKNEDSSGLGLNLSQKIMKIFGGSIKFKKSVDDFLVVSLTFKRGEGE